MPKLNTLILAKMAKVQIMEMGCYGWCIITYRWLCNRTGNDDKASSFLPLLHLSKSPLFNGLLQSDAVKAAADQLYVELRNAGIDVILDDRNDVPVSCLLTWN